MKLVELIEIVEYSKSANISRNIARYYGSSDHIKIDVENATTQNTEYKQNHSIPNCIWKYSKVYKWKQFIATTKKKYVTCSFSG